MLARRGERRVQQRGDEHIEVGRARIPPVLGVVVGALQRLPVGADRDRPPEVGARPRQRGEIGKRVEGQVDLSRGAAQPVAPDRPGEILRKLRGIEEAQEGPVRVEARSDLVPENFLAVVEDHPGDAAGTGQDPPHPGAAADLGPEAAGGAGERLRHRTHPAAREPPRAGSPVELPHVVVEQHIGGSRRGDAEEGADDPARRQGGLQGFRLEPAVEVVARARGHQPRQFVAAPVPDPPEVRASSTSPPISEGRTDPTRGGRIVSRSRTARLRWCIRRPKRG